MKVPLEMRPISLEFMIQLTEGYSYLGFYRKIENSSNF